MNLRRAIFRLLLAVGALVLLVPFLSFATSSGQPGTAPAGSPPASLDNFYPPKSPAPAYLLAMLGLAGPFAGLITDAQQGDIENVKANFERFKKAYLECAEMVPEWKSGFPIEPVDQLGAALAAGDPSLVMPAVQKVGEACHSCHVANMVPVQHKYHWNEFADIIVTDPLSGQDVNFGGLMMMLETNFGGIANDLEQAQQENAMKQLGGFKARFKAMSDACMLCHETERHYYVSKDVTDMIANLEVALAQPEVDTPLVMGLLQSIGDESCTKCHLVHIPAAYGQQMMIAH